MDLANTLENAQSAASRCIRDGRCTYGSWPDIQPVCPIYWHDPSFTFSGGGYLFLVLALLEKKIDFSQSIADFAYSCAGCIGCDTNCTLISSNPDHIGILDIIRLLRRESVKRGFVPQGAAGGIYSQVRESGDYGRPAPLQIDATISSAEAETVLFAECAHTASQADISKAVVDLLEKIGRPVALVAEKGCCGSTLYDFGFWDELGPLVHANWEHMRRFRDKRFLFTNPHCQEFVVKRYPQILPAAQSVDHQHISQLLASAFEKGLLTSKNAGAIRVSYHDPCYLGRGLGIYDAPRQTLSHLKGVELVEMRRNRHNAYCCGARTLGDYVPDLKIDTAMERIKEFRRTSTDLLITACPYCRDMFRSLMPDPDMVLDLVEFVSQRTE